MTVSILIAAGYILVQALPAGPPTVVTNVAPEALPPEVARVAQASSPGLTITAVERKEREDRVYFDVAGTRPDGAEIELDIQQTDEGYAVVEVQRDVAFDQMPPAVQAAARQATGGTAPVRIIESVQQDGSVIFELFAAGQPLEPAVEVRWAAGQAVVLTERWPH